MRSAASERDWWRGYSGAKILFFLCTFLRHGIPLFAFIGLCCVAAILGSSKPVLLLVC
jgi:hypothetical protein